MKYHNTQDQDKRNKVSNDLASNSQLTKREFTFEQRLHTDLFFGSGATKKHIDLVKLGLCFMSLEEALEAIPQSTKKEIVSGKLVEVANKTQENWAMFQLAWRTFHAPNSGIPQMYLDMYQPELTGEQELAILENKKSRSGIKKSWFQTINLPNGEKKVIEHQIKK
jgi:hypothetical protein